MVEWDYLERHVGDALGMSRLAREERWEFGALRELQRSEEVGSWSEARAHFDLCFVL